MATFLEILLVAMLGMLATSVRLQRLRRFRSVSALMSGGWLWVAAGYLLGPQSLGVVSTDTIASLTPILVIGLGWISLMVGMQAQRSVLVTLPSWVWRVAAIDVLATSILVGGATWIALRRWPGAQSPLAASVGVVMIVASAIGWSMETRWAMAKSPTGAHALVMLLRGAGGAVSLAAIALFAVSQSLSPNGATTPAAGGFATLALTTIAMALFGVAAGVFTRWLLRLAADSRADFLVVLLGVVSLTAGLGASVGVSPMLAPFALGAASANLVGVRLRAFERVILEAEHVVAAIFATLAGALLLTPAGLNGYALAGAVLVWRVGAKPMLAWLAPRSEMDAQQATPQPAGRTRLRYREGFCLIRQSPIAIVLGVALVVADPSDTARLLLGVVVLVGLGAEFASFLVNHDWRRDALLRNVGETEA